MKVKNLNEAPRKSKTLKDEVAKEMKADVDYLKNNLDAVVVGDTDTPAYKSVQELILDDALRSNLQRIRSIRNDPDADRPVLNVCFEGEQGVGKTKVVKDWARRNNINLYDMRASAMDTNDVGVLPTVSDDKTKQLFIRTSRFDPLERPRSVLFLDELNRARSQVRGTLLKAIDEHTIEDPNHEGEPLKRFPNWLFTIMCVNPASPRYKTDNWDPAELGRTAKAGWIVDIRSLLQHFNKVLDNDIAIAKEDKDDELLKLSEGRKEIINTILSPDCPIEFDTTEELDKLYAQAANGEDGKSRYMANGVFNYRAYSPRSLEFVLFDCDGTVEDFVKKWPKYMDTEKLAAIEAFLKSKVKARKDKANDVLDIDPDKIAFKGAKKAATGSSFDKLSAYRDAHK